MDFCIKIIFWCFCAGTTSYRTAIRGADLKGVPYSAPGAGQTPDVKIIILGGICLRLDVKVFIQDVVGLRPQVPV